MRRWLARFRGTCPTGPHVGPDTALITVSALALSALLTGVVRRFALSRGLLDVPNARSSHSAVTPRGGGVAIVVATVAASIALACLGDMQHDLFLTLIGGGSAVAAIGFMDDHRPISARVRIAVHVGAAVWAVAWIGAPSALSFGDQIISFGWVGAVLASVGIVWTLNLFNFMDGVDGIAASEAIFMACGGAALMLVGGASAGLAAFGLVVGAACLGFVLWNWPPAKIFMGDVGSGYLGYLIGVMALVAVRESPNALWTWLILGGVFFVDATVTLVRRTVRGERVYEAHRSHAYQWLARRWGSHQAVTLAVLSLNLGWLLPFAFLSVLNPRRAAWIALIALTPVVLMAFAGGAGRRESA